MIGKRSEVPPGPAVGPGVVPGVGGRGVAPVDGPADDPADGRTDPPPELVGTPDPSNEGELKSLGAGSTDCPSVRSRSRWIGRRTRAVRDQGALDRRRRSRSAIWLNTTTMASTAPTDEQTAYCELAGRWVCLRRHGVHLTGRINRRWPSTTPMSVVPVCRARGNHVAGEARNSATDPGNSGAGVHYRVDRTRGIGRASALPCGLWHSRRVRGDHDPAIFDRVAGCSGPRLHTALLMVIVAGGLSPIVTRVQATSHCTKHHDRPEHAVHRHGLHHGPRRRCRPHRDRNGDRNLHLHRDATLVAGAACRVLPGRDVPPDRLLRRPSPSR